MKWEIEGLIKKANQSGSKNLKKVGFVSFSASPGNAAAVENSSAQDLINVTEKYQKYKFPKDNEYCNKLPPPVKACIAGDKDAILIFLQTWVRSQS